MNPTSLFIDAITSGARVAVVERALSAEMTRAGSTRYGAALAQLCKPKTYGWSATQLLEISTDRHERKAARFILRTLDSQGF